MTLLQFPYNTGGGARNAAVFKLQRQASRVVDVSMRKFDLNFVKQPNKSIFFHTNKTKRTFCRATGLRNKEDDK